jgi:site-specific DNA-methyltransferase (adenine-specific)
VLFSSQPFTTDLINSNRQWFKYEWIWIKNSSLSLINRQPIRRFEEILIFYNKPPTFNEIQIKRTEQEYKLCARKNDAFRPHIGEHQPNLSPIVKRKKMEEQWYIKPINILEFNCADSRNGLGHPTQKPLELLEYLVLTYSNPNDVILDNCLGSGTAAVACKNLNRKWIGCELEEKYCSIAVKRLAQQILPF